MDTHLQIVSSNGALRIDSRILALQLGYDHKVVLQSIRRHKARLEAKSFLLQFEAKSTSDVRGRGRPEIYYTLDERQCLILTGSLKKGKEADEWHDRLVDAFLQARERVRQLESHQQRQSVPINSLWQQRLDLFNRHTRIPDGYWCVFNVTAAYCWSQEFQGIHLHEGAEPDISVGLLWRKYAREVLHLDMSLVRKYPHHYPDKRGTQLANIYPNAWLGLFHDWFQRMYIRYEFPVYLKSLRCQLPGSKDPILLLSSRQGSS